MAGMLEPERNFFEERRADLVRESHGKFVLIRGRTVHGLYGSERKAVAEGYRLFGPLEAFFVRRVLRSEEEVPAFLGVIGLLP